MSVDHEQNRRDNPENWRVWLLDVDSSIGVH